MAGWVLLLEDEGLTPSFKDGPLKNEVEAIERRGLGVLFPKSFELKLSNPYEAESLDDLRTLLIEFSKKSGKKWVHPGRCLWSDRPELSILCHELGLACLSPPVRVVSLFFNRLNLLLEAQKHLIPTLVMNFEPLQSIRELGSPQNLLYPFVLKSVWNRRFPNYCVVESGHDLKYKVPNWIEQLKSYFGEALFFVEQYLDVSRKVSAPFVRYVDGTVVSLPLVDQTLERAGRRYVEHCPAQNLHPTAEYLIRYNTERLLEYCGFIGYGTLDFLVDGAAVYLVGGRARLDSSVPVWEPIVKRSAIEWQFSAFEQDSLNAEDEKFLEFDHTNVGLSCRLYAEDSFRSFPRPGYVKEVDYEPSSRFETVFVQYAQPQRDIDERGEGALGCLTVFFSKKESFKQGVNELIDVLGKMWISGEVETNISFLKSVLRDTWVQGGLKEGQSIDWSKFQSVELLEVQEQALSTVKKEISKNELICLNRTENLKLKTLKWNKKNPFIGKGGRGVSGELDSQMGPIRVCAYPVRAGFWAVQVEEYYCVLTIKAEFDSKKPMLYSLVKGRVHAFFAREGQLLKKGDRVLSVESLQKLIDHFLPGDFRIKKWLVQMDDSVEVGTSLAELEPIN